jgi:hypothetical protein
MHETEPPSAAVYRPLNVNRRLLSVARECGFEDVEAEIHAEIERLKKLRRVLASRQ